MLLHRVHACLAVVSTRGLFRLDAVPQSAQPAWQLTYNMNWYSQTADDVADELF